MAGLFVFDRVEPMADRIRILLVEDEPLWQQGIAALLQAEPCFELVATQDDYDGAVQAFESLGPDAVLLDWKIRGAQDGLAVGDYLLSQGLPSHRIVLISGSEASMIPSHPFLFVPKSRIAAELLPLLTSVTIR